MKLFQKKQADQREEDLKAKWLANDLNGNEKRENTVRTLLDLTRIRWAFLKGNQLKYFSALQNYMMLWDRGEIESFSHYWKSSRDMAKEWEDLDVEEWKKKVNEHAGKEIYLLRRSA